MKQVTAASLARDLAHGPRSLPVVVNGYGVQAVRLVHGRIRRDLMGVSFTEMPEKPRDAALVMRFGAAGGSGMKLAEVQAAFEEHGDLEVFVWGTQVTAIRHVEAYYDRSRRRHVFSPGSRTMVATPLHWTEQSDGEMVESYVWTPPPPPVSHPVDRN